MVVAVPQEPAAVARTNAKKAAPRTYSATGDNRVVNSGTMNASTVAAEKGTALASNLAAEIAKYDAAKARQDNEGDRK